MRKDTEEIIEMLYHGKLCPSKSTPKTGEYKKVINKLNILADKFLENSKMKNDFMEFEEYLNMKQSIEAEFQFKNGFDLAIKLITESKERSYIK